MISPKTFLLVALVVALSPACRAAEEPPANSAQAVSAGEEVVEFLDETKLHGRIVKLGADQITFRHGDTQQELVFSLREIRRIILRAPLPVAGSRTNATLQLHGGDWLAGDLSSLERGTFQMSIGSLVNVAVPREKVKWLYLSPTTSPDGFEGPVAGVGLAGWEVDGDWEATDAGFVARTGPSPITKKFGFLPERVDIAFEVADLGVRGGKARCRWCSGTNRSAGWNRATCSFRCRVAWSRATHTVAARIRTSRRRSRGGTGIRG